MNLHSAPFTHRNQPACTREHNEEDGKTTPREGSIVASLPAHTCDWLHQMTNHTNPARLAHLAPASPHLAVGEDAVGAAFGLDLAAEPLDGGQQMHRALHGLRDSVAPPRLRENNANQRCRINDHQTMKQGRKHLGGGCFDWSAFFTGRVSHFLDWSAY